MIALVTHVKPGSRGDAPRHRRAMIAMVYYPPMDTEILAEGKYLRLLKEGRWEFVDRPNASGAVVIIAKTHADELILVDQFRQPFKRRVIELPAGLIGDVPEFAGEALADTANRELIEETGFSARTLRKVTEAPSSAAMFTELLHFFVADDVIQVGAGGGVDSEDIRVVLVSRAQLRSELERFQVEGWLVDPKVYAAPYFLGWT